MKEDPHAFVRVNGLPWQMCKKCGLLALRNPFTAWCIAHGCDAHEHPGYKAARLRLTKREEI